MVVWVAGEYVLEWSTPYVISLGSALVAYVGAALLARTDALPPPVPWHRAGNYELICADDKKRKGVAMYRAAGLAAIVGVLSLSTAHAQPPAPPAVPPATTITDLSPVTDAMLANPDPADWPMWRRTLDNWGYSPLDRSTAATSVSCGWFGRGR